MALHTKQLHYYKNGVHDINLYTTTEECGDHYIGVRDGSQNVYAPLIDPADNNASDIRVRLNDTTYAVASTRYEGIAFSDCTTAQIQSIVREGSMAANGWQIGDYHDITLNGTIINGKLTFDNAALRVVIIGMDHNVSVETPDASHNLHLALMMDSGGDRIKFGDAEVALRSTGENFSHKQNGNASNVTTWSGSFIKSTLMPRFFDALPTEWQNIIVECTKKDFVYENPTDDGTHNLIVNTTSNKLFIPSALEVASFSKMSVILQAVADADNTVQETYAYFDNNQNVITKTYGSASTSVNFWTRTNASCFWIAVESSTEPGTIALLLDPNSAATKAQSLLPCFVIA